MTQYALPDSDLVLTNWSEVGDGDGSAFDELDEGFGAGRGSGSGPDDATTYWITTVDLAFIQVGLTDPTKPDVTTGHIWRMRTRKSASSGQQQDHLLRCGTTISPNNYGETRFTSVSEVWTTREHTWDGSTGGPFVYTTITATCLVDEVGGGAGREGQVSAFEFECPDYPATPAFADAKLPAQNSYVGPFSS